MLDPAEREVVHEEETEDAFGHTTSQEGPRVFVTSPEGDIYVLFVKGVAKVDQASHEITMLAESPLRIAGGGDYLDGAIYFFSGSHLYS